MKRGTGSGALLWGSLVASWCLLPPLPVLPPPEVQSTWPRCEMFPKALTWDS